MQIYRIVSLTLSLLIIFNMNSMEKIGPKKVQKIKQQQRDLARYYKNQAHNQSNGDFGAYEDAVQQTLEHRQAKRAQKSKLKPQ